MSFSIILGTLLFALGVFQMLPWFRRRAEERGLSGWIGIPFMFAFVGFVTFVMGVFWPL